MKRFTLLLALVLTTTTLIGCNTMKGIGEDISSLGGAISESSDK